MRIVFLTHRYLPDIGGVELAVHALASEMTKAGHAVTIVTESRNGEDRHTGGGVRVLRIGIRKIRPFTRLIRWYWIWRHRGVFATSDVLHFHDYGTFIHWFLPFRLFFRNAVFAATFHGFDSWPIRLGDVILRRFTARCMNVTFAVGEYVRELYGQRIDHVYIGAPVYNDTTPAWEHTHTYLFIGRCAEDTGIRETAECLSCAAEASGVPVRLVLVGGGPLADDIEALSSGFLDVTRHPWTMEIGRFLASAGYVLGTGFLSILDAFRSGRPVIVPAFTEIKKRYFESFPCIGEYAFYVTSREELLNFLKNHLAKPDILSIRGKIHRATAFVRHLSWGRIADEHIAAYLHAMS